MDIAAWLAGLGLARYEAAFSDNDVDVNILPSLTADDLREMGIVSIGHRRRLLDAIALLRGGAGPSPREAPAPAEATPIPPRDAERRQLTVMFCDLVGSTPLAIRFDPEDLREVLGAYHRRVSETVGRFAGFVAKYMGDGVLIYFGYPRAHEDDAERAVRAGLAVIEAVGAPGLPADLAVRIGVASGLVVVGDLIGEGSAQERGVIGETPNLAARLQAMAEPNTVVIAEATRRQIGGLFIVEELGGQVLPGFAEPQQVSRVVGESGVVSRFEALRSGATLLVGRDEELDLLLRRWQQAKNREGRVVLVSGEAGIGKSRLNAALYAAVEGEPYTRLRWFCSPHHQDSALYPIIVQMERAAAIGRDDTAEAKVDKLRRVLDIDNGPDFELAAELLSLPNVAAELNLSAPRKREMLFEMLLRQVDSLAAERPVVATFEDVHWIDPTSREIVDLLIDRVRRLPVLLIVTFRPEFQAPWGGRPHVTSLALNRLGGREVAALVQNLAGNAPLGTEVVDEIVERTDGVPLFVEELTKAVLESSEQEGRVAAVLSASPVAALAVPPTLHASLIARLDRIGATAREVAQIGAVLGREFSYELIAPVAQRAEDELRAALAQLDQAGLLFCRGTPPDALYLFKHALVQDAAYGTLLRARRQELHARVAAVLANDFADLTERQPELLAHHLTAASDDQRAVEQWLKAGRFAATRLAHTEAIAHLERGLALLERLPETAARDNLEIELRLALGVSYIIVKGLSAPAVTETYRRARDLAEKSGDGRQRFQATFGSWQHFAGSGRVAEAEPYSRRLLQLAARSGDDGQQLQAHHSGWTTAFFGGRPAQAHAHCQEGRQLYDPERHRSHKYDYGGHDPGICARQTAAQAEWLIGYPDRALASCIDAMTLAEQIEHPFSLQIVNEYLALLHVQMRNTAQALKHIVASETLKREQRLSAVFPTDFLRGAMLVAADEHTDAIATIRSGMEVETILWRPFGFCVLAQALLARGEPTEARDALGSGFAALEQNGERLWEVELRRIEGLILQAQNRLEDAQAAFERALDVARQQEARSLELRGATDMARLWGEQGRRAEAVALLAPVYGSFTEGFDTADLKNAKTLLEALR